MILINAYNAHAAGKISGLDWKNGMDKVKTTTTIREILDRWPKTAMLFNKAGMGCPGCFMDQFERLGNALRIYHLPVEPFLREINEMVERSDKRKTNR